MVAGVTTPNSHQTEPAIEPQSCCGAPVRIGTTRMLELEGLDGLVTMARVRAYCPGCRVVVHPRGLQALVPLDTIALDQAQITRTVPIGPIGLFGTAVGLGLPQWGALGSRAPVTKIERADLWNDYEVLAHNKPERKARMRGLVGLTRNRTVRNVPTHVHGLPGLTISIGAINHMLDDRKPHRQGSDHLRFWPIIAQLANNPLEAWSLPITDEHNYQSYALLNTFRVGATIRNHLTLVNLSGRIITAYALSNIGGAERCRRGTLLHLGYSPT